MFMWNTPEQTYNIFVTLPLDKMDREGLTNFILEKVLKRFRKLRSRLTIKNFEWWWKEGPVEEALKRFEYIDKKAMGRNIKSKQDFIDWSYEQLAGRFDLENELPFKIYLIHNEENIPEYRNLIVCKVDHCISDGVAFMNVICGIADNYSPSLFPATMSQSFSFIYNIIAVIVFPYYLMLIIYNSIFHQSNDKTIFKTDKPVTGIPVIALSDRMKFDKYSKISKKLGITFNDMIASALSAASKKYMTNHSDHVPESLLVCFPINMKPLPKSLDEIVITNNSGGFGIKISLIDDILKEGKKISNSLRVILRNLNHLIAGKWMIDRMWYHMPFYTVRNILLEKYKMFDITLSNVPGPRTQLKYSGCNVLDVIPLFTPGFTHAFLGVISYGGEFKFTLTFDKSLDKDPNILINYMIEELKYLAEKLE
jgi:hypothetical protein